MLQHFNYRELIKYIIMLLGFMAMSCGLVLILHADLGMPPWDVFHLGLHSDLPLTYGRIIQGVGLVAIIISWLLGVKPKAGTFLNMFFIGLFVDVINATGLMPNPETVIFRFVQLMAGIALFSYGTMTYILLDRGTGPRDSLMVAFMRLSKLRMGMVRTIMEVSVTAVGFLLGGPLGIGTLIFALTMGPCMEGWHKVIRTFKGDMSRGQAS